MAKLARATGLTREALYRMLSAEGNPLLTSIAAILGAIGLRLTVVPAEPAPPRGKRASRKTKPPRIAAAA